MPRPCSKPEESLAALRFGKGARSPLRSLSSFESALPGQGQDRGGEAPGSGSSPGSLLPRERRDPGSRCRPVFSVKLEDRQCLPKKWLPETSPGEHRRSNHSQAGSRERTGARLGTVGRPFMYQCSPHGVIAALLRDEVVLPRSTRPACLYRWGSFRKARHGPARVSRRNSLSRVSEIPI